MRKNDDPIENSVEMKRKRAENKDEWR